VRRCWDKNVRILWNFAALHACEGGVCAVCSADDREPLLRTIMKVSLVLEASWRESGRLAAWRYCFCTGTSVGLVWKKQGWCAPL
jgi:hypothetical protein